MTRAASRRGGRRGGLVLTLTALLVLLLPPQPAWSHSGLLRSDPPNGGMVALDRSTVTLWYGGPIDLDASAFDLRARDGLPADLQVAVPPATDGSVVEIRAAPLEEGIYELEWRVLALDDGHTTSGSLVFGVGTRPNVVPNGGSGGLPGGEGLLARWMDLSLLLLAIGALAVSGRVLGATGGERAQVLRRRALRLGAVAAAFAVVSGAVTPFVRTPRGSDSLGVWWDSVVLSLTGTTWGHVWLARETALLVAAGALWLIVARRRASRARVVTAGVALAGAVLAESWAGHAATLASHAGPAVVASAFHLAAAGVWVGGLVALALCLGPTVRHLPGARGRLVASAWRAYGPMAAAAVGVLLVTGLYQSARHIPDLRAVGSTMYGGFVAAKLVLLTVAVLLAAVSSVLVNRRLADWLGRALGRPAGWASVPRRRLAVVVAAEVAVLSAAVGAAALLTTVPTARATESASRVSPLQSANVDGLFISFEEAPAGEARTRLIVRTRSTVRPEPAPIAGVDVTLVGPTGTDETVTLDAVETGRYATDVEAGTPGPWRARVAVHRPPVPDAVMQVGWTATDRAPARSNALDVLVTTFAVLMLTVLMGGLGLTRRRPPGRPETQEVRAVARTLVRR